MSQRNEYESRKSENNKNVCNKLNTGWYPTVQELIDIDN